MRFIWQHHQWPLFTWQDNALVSLLSKIRKQQGKILADLHLLGIGNQVQVYTEEAIKTSEIEGEKLDLESVRSSVAQRLGLKHVSVSVQHRNVDGLVEMLLDATSRWNSALTLKRLCGWHAALIPSERSGFKKIQVGKLRTSHEAMRVVSGRIGKEKIHFEAPPGDRVAKEMSLFLKWWKSSEGQTDGLIRAAIAHFYFVTIHPFEDGNGRIARAITDMAVAQDEQKGTRYYSLSSQIMKRRKAYYEVLERCQKGSGDITGWLQWFLELVGHTLDEVELNLNKSRVTGDFWKRNRNVTLNDRQRKVLQRLLDFEPMGFEGGLTNRKYVGLTRASRESAKRDLADLEEKGLIHRSEAGGRSISYSLVKK